ncbi:hypothetical protein [Umezawaea beigongshangensis]|uniref:hypothetical protein n=1 Tax=Umezawaea beigongshangensis TaxID=2780383 RepID=UPI001E390FFD|nr:hypothetical protein [Umezawaea beigongshangensis]
MQIEFTGLPTLSELAASVGHVRKPIAEHWSEVDVRFRDWASRPALRVELRTYLRALSVEQAARVRERSRETTTHFAWCLRDEPGEAFTFWLHEYKPQRDWRPGYADSVHNHRYHFSTTIVSGSYLHERFGVRLGPAGRSVLSARLERGAECRAGTAGSLLAHEFHRIPRAADGTLTFLVKSRAVMPWSLSFDPGTATSHRHVPVEMRLEELTNQL